MQSTNQGSILSVRTSDDSFQTLSSGESYSRSTTQQSIAFHHDYNRADTWNHITLPVTTAVDNTSSSASATLQAFSLAQGELTIGSNQLIQEIRLYDLAGRLILDNPLTLLHTTTTVAAPSGICLVEAVLRDGTTLHTQALVK